MSEPPEGQEEEVSGLDSSVGKMMVSVARKLAVYACDNLGLLIYTSEGQVRLPEVHEYLRAHVADPELLTNDDMAEALERAGSKYMNVNHIDELLGGIENRWLRGGVNTGIGWAKRLLHRYPDFVKELQVKKDTILLTFLAGDPATGETYKLLKDRPRLTTFITEAFMFKMGVPLAAPPSTPAAGVQ